MPFNPFSAFTSKLFAGLSLALLLAVGVQTVRLGEVRSERNQALVDLGEEREAHAATRQSVDTLDAVIEDLNERALARAEAYAEGQAEAQKRSAELAKLSAESDKRIAALRAEAREQVNGDCPTPANLAELAEGL